MSKIVQMAKEYPLLNDSLQFGGCYGYGRYQFHTKIPELFAKRSMGRVPKDIPSEGTQVRVLKALFSGRFGSS